MTASSFLCNSSLSSYFWFLLYAHNLAPLHVFPIPANDRPKDNSVVYNYVARKRSTPSWLLGSWHVESLATSTATAIGSQPCKHQRRIVHPRVDRGADSFTLPWASSSEQESPSRGYLQYRQNKYKSSFALLTHSKPESMPT